jgi:hypothetical protein
MLAWSYAVHFKRERSAYIAPLLQRELDTTLQQLRRYPHYLLIHRPPLHGESDVRQRHGRCLSLGTRLPPHLTNPPSVPITLILPVHRSC